MSQSRQSRKELICLVAEQARKIIPNNLDLDWTFIIWDAKQDNDNADKAIDSNMSKKLVLERLRILVQQLEEIA